MIIVQIKIITVKEKKVREFHIAAIQKDIKYNDFKDHDPDGLLFVPYEYKDDIISGKMEPTPLILRAKKGECIKVKLTNCFTKPIPYYDFPGVPVDKEVTPSMRVGISPQFLRFDPVTDSGINVGYNNLEQTVKPGDSKTYSWYADEEYGTCLLSSLTDIRNHRYHGLFGAIIIEPEGSKIESDNIYGEQVTIAESKTKKFREFVIFMHNGIRLLDVEGKLIMTNQEVEGEEEGEEPEPVDFEDRGEKGFNYRSERFFNRLQENPDISKVFSSKVHGDPATPIFEASPGERVIIRLLMPADKPRNVCFVLHGHKWKAQPSDPFPNIISAQGAMGVGNVFNIELLNGAATIPGDYLYRAGNIMWDIESGMWGIFRIKDNDTNKENDEDKNNDNKDNYMNTP
ncbi:multicopper oxidase domain-containing protein [Clostridium perfringens]|uniref:multicopper oxidase domain-containing protein n=1 Tax=Clostridium perfringens TaxID=1502 RepID=UPI002245C5D3|nr:multicopper oxidase domain-containing protein [Clostridium perfringens]MCX0360670.1 multicopper oxidase domain-containing protein [Clostridium perfringens]